MAKIFGVQVGGEKPKRRTERTLTKKDLERRAQIRGLEAIDKAFQDNPDEALRYGQQILKMKPRDIMGELFQNAIMNDPELRDQYVQKELRKRGLEGADFMEKFMAYREFFDAVGNQGNKSSGIASLFNPEVIVSIAQILPMLAQMANGQTPVATNRQLANGHTPALQSGKESENVAQNTVDEELDLVDDYIEELFTMMTKTNIPPEDCAKWALTQLNHIVLELRKAGQNTSKAEQIYNVLTQPPQVMVVILDSAASMSGRSDYVEAVQHLKTPEGQQYIAKFCDARDQFLKAMQQSQVQDEEI